MTKKPLHTSVPLHNKDQFTDSYTAYSQRIYRYLLRRTRDQQLSEDLSSNVFEKAWKSRDSFHGGSVPGWLYSITRNVLIDYCRKTKEIAQENFDSYESNSEELGVVIDKQHQIEAMKQAIVQLPEEMQTVIKLRFIDNLPAKTVADRMGTSEGNVRIIQYRALKQLRKLL